MNPFSSSGNINKAALWTMFFFLSLGWVFLLHRGFLTKGFYRDDFFFLQVAEGSRFGTRISAPNQLLEFWNPWRGWFYRPVFLLYMAFGQMLWGAHPIWFHAAGLVLHAGVVLLLGTLVWRLTGRCWTAFFSALSFSLWPGKTEAIWWISSHSTLLASLFSLATLIFWLDFRQSQSHAASHRAFALSLFCCWLALCSKSDTLSLPLALLALDVFRTRTHSLPRSAEWRRDLKAYWPVFGLWCLFVWCEWNAAVFYARNDPYLSTMTVRPFIERFRYLGVMIDRVLLLMPSPRGWRGALSFIIVVAAGRFLGRYRHHCWYEKHKHALGFWAVWTGVASVPIVVLAGAHALESRFSYYPMMPAATFWVLLSSYLVHLGATLKSDQSAEAERVTFAAASVIAALVSRLPWTLIDPVVIWLLLCLVVAAALFLWKVGAMPGSVLLVLSVITLASQLSIFVPLEAPVWEVLALSLCALAMGRVFWWAGALCILLAWPFPHFFVAALAGCYGWWNFQERKSGLQSTLKPASFN